MLRALLQIVLNGVAILIAAYLVPGISYHGSLLYLLLVGLVFGLINLIVKPIVSRGSDAMVTADVPNSHSGLWNASGYHCDSTSLAPMTTSRSPNHPNSRHAVIGAPTVIGSRALRSA